jgi:TP901 family phage tail tape measure protein
MSGKKVEAEALFTAKLSDQLSPGLKGYIELIGKLKTAFKEHGEQQAKVDAITKNYNKTVNDNSNTIKKMDNTILSNIKVLDKLHLSLNLNIKNLINFGNASKTAGAHSIASFASVGAAANLMSQGITASFHKITESAKENLDMYIHLESKINQIQGQFGEAAGTFEELGNRILDASHAMAKGPLDAAASIQKFMPILDNITLATEAYTEAQVLSTAAHIQNLTATKLDINLIKMYGIEVKDLASAHNDLVKAQKWSNVTQQEYFQNLPTVTVRAAQAGVSIKTMGTEYALLTNTLKSAPQAATSYAALIQQIEQSTQLKKKVEELNKATGSNIKVGASAIREAGGSVLQWVRELGEAFKKTADGGDHFMAAIKYTQASKAMQGLLSADRPNEQRADKKSFAQRALEDSQNKINLLKQMYDKAVDSIENRLEGFKNSFHNIWLKFLLDHEHGIKTAMDKTEDLVNTLLGWGVQFKNFCVELNNDFNGVTDGIDFSDIGNTSIQILEALGHTTGNIIKTLATDIGVIMATIDVDLAKIQHLRDLLASPAIYKQLGTNYGDAYFYKSEQAVIKAEARLVQAQEAWSKSTDNLTAGLGNFNEPEYAKRANQRPTKSVPTKLNDYKGTADPLLGKTGDIQLDSSKPKLTAEQKKAAAQARKDSDFLDQYNSLHEQAKFELEALLADNSLEKDLAKVKEKFVKLNAQANEDYNKAKDKKTKKAISIRFSDLINLEVAEKGDVTKKYEDKAKDITDKIKNINDDLKQRIEDIKDGNNFTSVMSKNDFVDGFNKGTADFEELLGKYGFNKEQTKSLLDEIKGNLSTLTNASEAAFKKSRNDFADKILNKGDKALSKSATGVKEAELETSKLFFNANETKQSIANFRGAVEEEKSILSERLDQKKEEIKEGVEYSIGEAEREIRAKAKLGTTEEEITALLEKRKAQIKTEARNAEKEEDIKTSNAKLKLEQDVADKVKEINKKNTDSLKDMFKSAVDAVLPGFSGMLDQIMKIIDKNDELEKSLLKTFGLFTEDVSGKSALPPGPPAKPGATGPIFGSSDEMGLAIKGSTQDVSKLVKEFGLVGREATAASSKAVTGLNEVSDNTKGIIPAMNALGGATKAFGDTAAASLATATAGLTLLISWATWAYNVVAGNQQKIHQGDVDIVNGQYQLNQMRLQQGAQTADKLRELARLEYENTIFNLKEQGKAYYEGGIDQRIAAQKLSDDLVKIKQDEADREIQIQVELGKKIIEVQKGQISAATDIGREAQRIIFDGMEDSLAKTRAEIEYDREQRKKDALKEYVDLAYAVGVGLEQQLEYKRQYEAKLKNIDDDSNVKIINAEKETGNKIQSLNQKNYDTVIKLKTLESQKKIDLLKSEIATELDLVQNKQKRLDQLEEDRKLSREQKLARAAAFASNLTKTPETGDFYRIANPDDFENNALGGNSNIRKQAQTAYDQGGTYENYAQSKVLTGTRQFQYYQYLAENETNLKQKQEYLDLAEQGRQEAEDYLIDAEKAKINSDAKIAAEKLKVNTAELKKEEAAQQKVIDAVDLMFKDSQGNMRTEYVTGFRGFISDISPDITKLGVDLYNALNEAKKVIADSDREIAKINNPAVPPPTTSGSTPTNTVPKPGDPGFIGPLNDPSLGTSMTSGNGTNLAYHGTGQMPENGPEMGYSAWELAVIKDKVQKYQGSTSKVESLNLQGMDAVNKYLHSLNVPGYKDGGVSSGPDSGYLMMAHGDETHLNARQMANVVNLLNMPKIPSNRNYNNSSQQTIQVINHVTIQGNDPAKMKAGFDNFTTGLASTLTRLGIK